MGRVATETTARRRYWLAGTGKPVWLAGKRTLLLREYQFAFAGDGQAVFLAGMQNAQLTMAAKQRLGSHAPMPGRTGTRSVHTGSRRYHFVRGQVIHGPPSGYL